VGALLKLSACGGQALADNGPAAVYGKIQVNDCLLKCVALAAAASASSCMLALDVVPDAHVAGICYRVDGEDVYRQPIEKVIKYILGEMVC
jgi:hypothetical protein